MTPIFLLDFYHYLLAFISAVVFWFPSRKLVVIGVTGTSGKSTTVDFITRILEEAGNKVVSNSSVRFKVGDKEWPNNLKMGMPGRFFMQKLLRTGLKSKCNYAVLEVTSEGIKQYRHKFINFNTAVFTNLSPEHIESHGGFENYRNEKLKLFKVAKNIHIINADDENSKYFLDIPAKKTINFGADYAYKMNGRQLHKHKEHQKNKESYSSISHDNRVIAEGISRNNFWINGVQFHLNLLGNFNVYNALAAISVGLSEGISLEICKKALEKVSQIPGRMEVIVKEPFLVVVDYAHTPDQLEQVYKSLNGKPLICVLGSCGGGRDKWKRPVLGKIASQYCSQIIITNEDPYDENPLSIMDEIASGIQHFTRPNFTDKNLGGQAPNTQHLILDRRGAIKKAITLAKPGATVIITGKGSELWMCVENGKKIPWDDRQIVREELKLKKIT